MTGRKIGPCKFNKKKKKRAFVRSGGVFGEEKRLSSKALKEKKEIDSRKNPSFPREKENWNSGKKSWYRDRDLFKKNAGWPKKRKLGERRLREGEEKRVPR